MSEKAAASEEGGVTETSQGCACAVRFLPEILSFLVASTQASTARFYLVYASCERLHPHRTDCASNTNYDDDIQVILGTFKEFWHDRFRFRASPMPACRYVEEICSAAMLAAMRSAGVAPEANERVKCTPL